MQHKVGGHRFLPSYFASCAGTQDRDQGQKLHSKMPKFPLDGSTHGMWSRPEPTHTAEYKIGLMFHTAALGPTGICLKPSTQHATHPSLPLSTSPLCSAAPFVPAQMLVYVDGDTGAIVGLGITTVKPSAEDGNFYVASFDGTYGNLLLGVETNYFVDLTPPNNFFIGWFK